jgi:hypothetical protein
MVEILTRRRVWGGWRVRVEGPGAGMGMPNPAPNPAGAIRNYYAHVRSANAIAKPISRGYRILQKHDRPDQ